MKLYCTKRSPYARKVRIMAIEKKIQLDLVEEDLTKKSPDLLKINPLGKIPALLLDNGDVVYDSPVICEYIDSLNKTPQLIPSELNARLKVKRWEALSDGLMDISVALYMEKQRHPQDFHQPFVTSQEETIRRGFKFINDHVGELKDLSLALIAAVSAFGYAQFRVGYLLKEDELKNLYQWAKEFSKRESIAQTLPS